MSRTVFTAEQLDANRFAMVSSLADQIAHELKNPLHAMVINLEVVRSRVTAGARDAALDRIDVIQHEIQRLHRHLELLLRLLRPPPDETAVTLAQLLEDVVPLLEIQARLARHQFTYQPPDDAIQVRIRRDLFAFAFLNLSQALLQSLHGNGRVTVRVDPSPDRTRVCLEAGPASSEPPGAGLESALGFARAWLLPAGGTATREDPGSPENMAASLALPTLFVP